MDQQNDIKNNENQYLITEQGDLGLGTRQLTDKEQALVEEQQAQYRRNQQK